MEKYFEKAFEGVACQFEILNSMISDQASASDYCARIKRKYDRFFKEKDARTINQFGIRYYRAKKLVYSSAQMWMESRIAKGNECTVSYYFLMYYALFQAMQANLIIDPSIGNEKAEKLGHGEVPKIFKACYCDVKSCPMDDKIIAAFWKLRDCREYFSYAMPFQLTESVVIHDEEVNFYLKACYQLMNLQLFIISEKCRRSIDIDRSELDQVRTYFIKQCNRLGGFETFTDPADEDFWIDLKNCLGIDLMPLSIAFEHDFDEYGTYDETVYKKIGIPNTGKIVSGALRYLWSAIC